MFDKASELQSQLEQAKVRVTTDYRDNYTPGWVCTLGGRAPALAGCGGEAETTGSCRAHGVH